MTEQQEQYIKSFSTCAGGGIVVSGSLDPAEQSRRGMEHVAWRRYSRWKWSNR